MSELRLADLPIRADLRDMTPYGAPQFDVPVALNTNENPIPLSAELSAAIGVAVTEAAHGLNRYPDRDATQLRSDLAEYLGNGLTQDNVWAANGSNEVLQQLLQVFGGPGRTALGFEPSYSMHPVLSRVTGTTWLSLPRDEHFRIDSESAVAAIERHEPTLVLLTSPNNPTGTALDPETIEAIAQTAPGLVIVDEAYAEFRREQTPSAVELIERFPRLVVTRTMSKAFALAGARIGYLAAHPAVVEALQLVRLPYHLSATSQVVAGTALAHATELLGSVNQLRAERDACVSWLGDQGYTVAESDANFVLFGTFTDRTAIWQGLLDRGVLVREVGPSGWLRVTIGTPEEMATFRSALLGVTQN